MSASFEPEQFGRYFLVDKVAVGGMAEVFKARIFREGGFQKLLVIKRILGHLGGNEEFVDMFIDEAKISVELQHPNIVQVYDFGKIGGNYFIAMECIEGKDIKGLLRKLAERRKVLPVEYAACIAHEMCKGLDFAHKKHNLQGDPLGIIHRDVSPSNILVSYDGNVKVADFGIAKAGISLYNTKDGVLKGKFQYMSPEQAAGEDVTTSADIFACGIILHEMLTGRRLFKADSEVKTLKRIRAADIPLPSQLNPAVPARMDEIVMRALARQPADRFADCREFQQALLEFMYPSTPEVVRDSLKHFMRELFESEIAAERRRLREGSAAAVQIWESASELALEEEWAEEAGSARTMQTSVSRMPMALAVVAVMLALAVATFVAVREPVTRVVEVEKAVRTGSVHLRVTPAGVNAAVYLRDERVGNGTGMVLVEDAEPGMDIPLRVEAEGHAAWNDTIDLVAGERLRVLVALQEAGDPARPRPPASSGASGSEQAGLEPLDSVGAEGTPPTARFRSTPSGARVYVDGRLVGRTPVDWDGGSAGSSAKVEYRLGGHNTATFSIRLPVDGRSVSFPRSLEKRSAEPGKVSVNVKSGWANVFIDGQRVDTTPLFNHVLTPGRHDIRVVNESTGMDESRSVTIASGEASSVTF
ncbi:MAG: serine/threonine-protein kinase [Myxococcota bacterium]|nr:serine/threonine-protein kinase [Myxococcota bacterium]MEC8422576.1 serine/threonine-protein kinase [Myxococcota bacterium]